MWTDGWTHVSSIILIYATSFHFVKIMYNGIRDEKLLGTHNETAHKVGHCNITDLLSYFRIIYPLALVKKNLSPLKSME